MSSLDDSKLTNIKLDDTHDASSPISASPQIENVFLNDKNVPIEQNQKFLNEIIDWIDKNPVNCGPNWKCSQEISLRVMNWVFAIYFYKI